VKTQREREHYTRSWTGVSTRLALPALASVVLDRALSVASGQILQETLVACERQQANV
jgi:hypothetical protein